MKMKKKEEKFELSIKFISSNVRKTGQVTIFVVFGLIILFLALLVAYFYPQIKVALTGETLNPSSYLQSCIEEELKSNIQIISSQGGSLDPTHYLLYKDQRLEYLCYTNEYYKTCVMQQPFLKQNIEQEVEKSIFKKAEECLTSLEQTYKRSGYDVKIKKGGVSLELLPKRAVLYFNSTIIATKADSTQRYEDLRISIPNNLYELVSIATSILNFEARYGDSETTIYMNYYHDLKVEKIKQEEGSKIYILTDRNNGNKFQFATRSLAWPPAV
jgi:hypothetical protein